MPNFRIMKFLAGTLGSARRGAKEAVAARSGVKAVQRFEINPQNFERVRQAALHVPKPQHRLRRAALLMGVGGLLGARWGWKAHKGVVRIGGRVVLPDATRRERSY